jgi:hypothetical protein
VCSDILQLGADFSFGVSFLQTIGYWDPTTQSFADAAGVCKQVKAELIAMGLKSHESQSALSHLESIC